jgi:hypothetical protein
VTLTGLVWTRYSTQINPINYNLMTVNAFMAVTGIYQLSRKIRFVRGCNECVAYALKFRADEGGRWQTRCAACLTMCVAYAC